MFSALLFTTLDMALKSAATAAFVTYLVMGAVGIIRAHWGETNISRKTLVDQHFLI